MFKKLTIVGALAALTLPAMAQYENLDLSTTDLTNEETRFKVAYIGNEEGAEPYALVSGQTTMMQLSYSSKDWKAVREAVLWLKNNAPIASTGIYPRGAYALYMLITDPQSTTEEKKTYLNDMMDLFDTRLKYLKYLNASVAEGKKGRATEGDVLLSKADYFYLSGNGVSDQYTYNTIYDMYQQGMRKVNEEGGHEVQGVYLRNFFNISDQMYKTNNDYYREQYLNDYLESKEVCEKMLQLAKEETDSVAAKKIVDMYDQPLAYIEMTFAQSGAANREQLIALYTPKVEENKTDLAYLRSAMNVLSSNDCDDTDVYYAASRYAYDIEPTYESAIGLAAYSKKIGKQQDMITYYNKALELCQSDKQRGRICYEIAKSLMRSKQYTGANVYLDQAQTYNPDLKGRVLYQKAIVATHLGQYSQALSLCSQSGEADITLSGQANRLADQIRKYQSDQASVARQRAAYEKYMKEKQEEEDFWKRK